MREDDIILKWCSHIFDGRDEDVRACETRIVLTRTAHQCLSPLTMKMHDIPAGTRAMREHAIVDGVWCSSYSCCACLEAYMDDEELEEST